MHAYIRTHVCIIAVFTPQFVPNAHNVGCHVLVMCDNDFTTLDYHDNLSRYDSYHDSAANSKNY